MHNADYLASIKVRNGTRIKVFANFALEGLPEVGSQIGSLFLLELQAHPHLYAVEVYEFH
jgi:hypothetical protein